MDFILFNRLYCEAKEYENLEMFIAERGWQEWMDNYKIDDITTML